MAGCRWLRNLSIVLVLVSLSTGRRSFADEPAAAPARPDAARHQAKELRDQGANAAQAHDFVVALDCFERAYAIYPSANLLFNIGVALDRLQRSERAIAAFEEFLATATDAPAIARDFARERVRALEPRVARLTLVVSPPDAAVQLDGVPLYASRVRPLPMAPGEHVLVAIFDGRSSERRALTLTAGEEQRLTLAVPPTATAGAAPEILPAPRGRGAGPPSLPSMPLVPSAPGTVAERAPAPSSRRLRWAGIGVAGFGVVALGVGAGLAANTAALDRAANHPATGTMFDPGVIDRGRTSQALEIGFLAVGGAAAATGTALVIVAARRGQRGR
jgi:hypothetical protein